MSYEAPTHMARWEFPLPDLGEGVTEGEIVAWLVSPGDEIREDAPVVEVMTDKATMTITSSRAGKVLETHGKVGDIAKVHAVLAVLEVAGGETGLPNDVPTKVAAAPALQEVAAAPTSRPDATAAGSALGPAGSALATPATRKLARELGVDLDVVRGSGEQGRVTKEDLEAHVVGGAGGARGFHVVAPPSPAVVASAPGQSAREPVRIAPSHALSSVPDERVPFAGMRRKIAGKMAQSKHTAAHFTFVEECDATSIKALRARMKLSAEKEGVKLTFLPFIVKAVVASLKKHPILNSALDESTSELVYRKGYHIGIAASTDAGLMVPVVRDADRKSVLEIAREIDRLGSEARAGKAKAEDLSGSTFTITSLGAQGGLFATPILNFPEVGILGVHQMKQKPVVKDGAIVIGDVMLLSLSFDHRIVDGHVGAAFAYDVIGYLENPDKLFLDL